MAKRQNIVPPIWSVLFSTMSGLGLVDKVSLVKIVTSGSEIGFPEYDFLKGHSAIAKIENMK